MEKETLIYLYRNNRFDMVMAYDHPANCADETFLGRVVGKEIKETDFVSGEEGNVKVGDVIHVNRRLDEANYMVIDVCESIRLISADATQT